MLWRPLWLGFVLALGAGAAAADPCSAPLPRSGTTFADTVRYIGDGDSFCVGPSSDPQTWIEVRLADFYAPELHAAGGPQAKAALARIALGRVIQCRAGRRSYDRVIAWCRLTGVSLGDLMRGAGIREGGKGR